MKKVLLSLVLLVFGATAFAQDLPENPEPGKCYVRCKTPEVWKNEDVTIEVAPAYKKIVTHPAEYITETERVEVKQAAQRLEIVPAVYETRDVVVVTKEAAQRLELVPATYETKEFTVLVKEASYKLEYVPATYGKETLTYTAKEDGSKLRVIPATFTSDSETIEVKPASAKWQMSDKAPDCQSSDPDDCRYWCYKEIPGEYVTIPQTKLGVDAHTERTGVPGFEKTYTRVIMETPPTTRRIEIPEITKTEKRVVMATPPTTRVIDIPEVTKVVKKTVMVTPPTTRVIDIPAEFSTIKKVKLSKDAWEEEVTVPAKYKTVTKEVLVSKGGLTTWEEVECAALEYNPLPINWNLGSATLTSAAKSIIDRTLLPILRDGKRVELASHTDSRGTTSSNQDLSERRARAVSNYLISKGINPSLLVANGYGETKLTNRCADGVSCTEREHLANRRTEFRVINQ